MKVYLIRHGMTPGNLLHQYVGGRTDQPLSEEGKQTLQELKDSGIYPETESVFVSPMKRCAETAQVLFPDAEQIIVEGLKEMDFGVFEGRSAADMEDDEQYQAWVATMCEAPIPGGEVKEAFTERCCKAFAETMQTLSKEAEHVSDTDKEQCDGQNLPEPTVQNPELIIQKDKKPCDGQNSPEPTAKKEEPAVFAIHGGTIMALLSRFGRPEKGYYDWYVKNGHGYVCEWDGAVLKVDRQF